MSYHGSRFPFVFYVATPKKKSSERSHLCASCDKKGTGCTRASAADTFDLWRKSVMVSMGVSCPSWGQWTCFSSMLERGSMVHTTARCYTDSEATACHAWDWWQVPYFSWKAIFPLTERARQSSIWNDRHLRSFQQTIRHTQHRQRRY